MTGIDTFLPPTPRRSLALLRWRCICGPVAAMTNSATSLYFIVCGQNLAWGYIDLPPMVPLIARAA